MIKYSLFISMMLMCMICNAQTWDEWFRQKQTQIKYLEEQVIALQVYSNYLQKGYNIVGGGLSVVHDIKNGDFNLHKDYFKSLRSVNTAVASTNKTSDVINLQLQILQLNTVINKHLGNTHILSSESRYIRQVMNDVLEKCATDITDLTSLTTDGVVTMKDDKRLKRIDAIYVDMMDKYSFTCYFKEQIQLLNLSRIKESNNVQTLQSLYNIK